MSKFYSLGFLLLLNYLHANSQEIYTLKKDSIKALKEYEVAKKNIDKMVEDYDGQYKKELKEEVGEWKKTLKKEFKNFYFNEEYDEYLSKIIQAIKSKNPILENVEIRPYYYYDESVNASMAAYGTMRVHLGLFDVIENESQLALVLAHEIGHYTQRHSIKAFGKRMDHIKSDESKEDFRDAKREGIDRIDRVEEYFKNRALSLTKFSREDETEADSIGFYFLKNTPYALDESVKALLALKKSDTEEFEMDNIIRKVFHNDDFPFNDAWLKKPNSIAEKLKFKISPELRDSLSTHPNVKERYSKLKGELSPDYQPDIVEVSFETFDKMKKDFKKEIVHFLLQDKQYGQAMYYILKYINENSADKEILEQMPHLLDKMKASLNDHTLNRYVPTRNPYFLPQYNNVLNFIDKLSVDDFETLKLAYKKNFGI